MRKYVLGFAVLAVLAVSCKKDKDLLRATVIDTGDIAKGGCGYLLQLTDDADRKEVRPKYLPSAYQHPGMKVKVKYDADGEGGVCDTHPTKKFIEIVDITVIKQNLD